MGVVGREARVLMSHARQAVSGGASGDRAARRLGCIANGTGGPRVWRRTSLQIECPKSGAF